MNNRFYPTIAVAITLFLGAQCFAEAPAPPKAKNANLIESDNKPSTPPKAPTSSEADEANAVVRETVTPIGEPLATGKVEVAIDWNSKTAETSRRQFSVAGFSAFTPEVAGNPLYHKALEYIGGGLLRYHNTQMLKDSKEFPNGWMDIQARTWDAAKVKTALSNWRPAGVEKVICIPYWPKWMDIDEDNALDADQYDAYAKLCAELVHIVNVEGGFGVKYWEITNERDLIYWLRKGDKPKRHDLLADIYMRAAIAMKKVDPNILTGGPSATRSDLPEELRPFVRAVAPQLDFLSFHSYASGRLDETDASIFGKPPIIGRYIRNMRTMVEQEIPGRKVELHLNEYNIQWTWRNRDLRMVNHKGAVFDAMMMIEFANNRLDVSNAWNERDGIYGKMDKNFVLRPSANVYHNFNKLLVGQVVALKISDARRISALAVAGATGPALSLVNFTDAPQMVTVKQQGSKQLKSALLFSRVDASGYQDLVKLDAKALKGSLELPPHSVTFIHRSP